ncbi:MAG: GC-type dockerin domain-anchored protein [Phycisphaerales bacterium]|nr:GC-type dockerin domain-anchored protein [Phycisphaerales bacterium]
MLHLHSGCRKTATTLVVAATAIQMGTAFGDDCGTLIPAGGHSIFTARMASGGYRGEARTSMVPDVVKITWHVVTSTLGERSIEDSTLAAYAEGLNEAFLPMGIEFCFRAEPHLIIDDELMMNVSSHYHLRMIEPTTDAIDIYWCNSLSGGALCGVSSYSFGPIQGVAIQTSCEGHDDVLGILIHEVGHYFDLFHTHEIGFGYECPEGSDCSTHGDHVCDTSPAPPLGFETCVDPADCSLRISNPDCTDSIGPPLCPEGQQYDPDTDNYMSYTAIPCLIRFTEGQFERMRTTFDSYRPELHDASCGPLTNCQGDVNHDGLVNGSDISMVIASWGSSDPTADLDGDGIVNATDLVFILGNWQGCN